jgi:hypothetical protein
MFILSTFSHGAIYFAEITGFSLLFDFMIDQKGDI